MEGEDVEPSPQVLFVNERFDINERLKTESNPFVHDKEDGQSHDLNNGRFSPQDRRIFADDYLVDSKRSKFNNEKCGDIVPALDNNNTFQLTPGVNLVVNAKRNGIATASDSSSKVTLDENFVVKVEIDDTEEDYHHHLNLVNPELNLNNLKSLGQKVPCDNGSVEDCEIKSEPEPEADRAALLKYYLSTTSALDGHEVEGEARSSQNGASSSNGTFQLQLGKKKVKTLRPHITREQRAAARNAIKERLEAEVQAATKDQPQDSQGHSWREKETQQHTLELHRRKLNKMCRVCGRQSLSAKQRQKRYRRNPILCEKHKDSLLTYYRIDVSQESNDQYPTTLCVRCCAILRTYKRRVSEQSLTNALSRINASRELWVPFDPAIETNSCSSCRHYDDNLGFGAFIFDRNLKLKLKRRFNRE